MVSFLQFSCTSRVKLVRERPLRCAVSELRVTVAGRLDEAQRVKAGAVSASNPTPGSWLTANLARAYVRGTAQASLIPASLPGTTAITGVTSGPMAAAIRSSRGIPMVELVRTTVKVPQDLEPSDGMVTMGPAGAPSAGAE